MLVSQGKKKEFACFLEGMIKNENNINEKLNEGWGVECVPIMYVFVAHIAKSDSFWRTLLGAYSGVQEKDL